MPRAHTPIMSKAQRGMFGAELARREKGKKGRIKGITTAELENHLHESAGKKLPYKVGHSPLHTNPMPNGGEPCCSKFTR